MMKKKEFLEEDNYNNKKDKKINASYLLIC